MFSPSLHLIFSFSYKHLLKTEVFNFDEVQFTQLLTECVFVIILRNLCPTQRNFGCDGSGHYLDCSTVYTDAYKVTKIFCHFCLEVLWFYGIGVSMIHFRWILVYNLWRYGLKFWVCCWYRWFCCLAYRLFHIICWKDYPFSRKLFFCTFVKITLTSDQKADSQKRPTLTVAKI